MFCIWCIYVGTVCNLFGGMLSYRVLALTITSAGFFEPEDRVRVFVAIAESSWAGTKIAIQFMEHNYDLMTEK